MRSLIATVLATLLVACGTGSGLPDGDGVALRLEVFYDRPATTRAGLDYGTVSTLPVRGARVELIREDDPGTVLDEGVLDDDGEATLFAPWPGAEGAVPYDAIVRIYAETVTPPIQVEDNTADDAVYVHEVAGIEIGPAGFDGLVRTPVRLSFTWVPDDPTGTYTDRTSAPFAILDAVYQAASTARRAIGGAWPVCHLNWSPQNVSFDVLGLPFPVGSAELDEYARMGALLGAGPYFARGLEFSGRDEIFLQGRENVSALEFDRHVIVHEWAHWFEHFLSRKDTGGIHTRHDWTDGAHEPLDFRLAFQEGWAHAIAAMVFAPDTVAVASMGPNQQSIPPRSMDVEDTSDLEPSPGWDSELAIASVLLDIADSENEAPYDNVSLGVEVMFQVSAWYQRNTTALTSIFSFVNGLKLVHPESAADIDEICEAHGIAPILDDYGTDRTNDGGWPHNAPLYHTLPDAYAPMYSVTLTNPMSPAWSGLATTFERRFFRHRAAESHEYTVWFNTLPQLGYPADDHAVVSIRIFDRGEEVSYLGRDQRRRAYGLNYARFRATAGTEYIVELTSHSTQPGPLTVLASYVDDG